STSARKLGELVTGAVLVRETMAPDYRLQALLRSRDNRFRLVADSHPDGGSRALLTRASRDPDAARQDPAGDTADYSFEGGTLEVVRTLYNGELHRGVVAVEAGGMSKALMSYLQGSEQVAS